MDHCLIKKVNFGGYNRFLLCLNFESIVNYLPEIESASVMVRDFGKILIDQLLVTGNGSNRFLECSFKDGKLDFSSAKNVTPDNNFRQMTVDLLRELPDYFECSILTKTQKENVRQGIAF